MTKLFFGEFHRLLHFKLYRLECIAVIVFSVYPVLFNDYSITPSADGFLFQIMPKIFIFSAILVSQFIGEDYSCGTLRNKIFIGHSRIKIYLVQLVLNFLAAVNLLNISAISVIISCALRRWKYDFTADMLIKNYLMCLCTTLMIAAVCLIISINSNSRILPLMALLAMFYIFNLLGADAHSKLAEPKMRLPYEFETVEGNNKPVPNKMYQNNKMRIIYENILLIDPCGQAYYESEAVYDCEKQYFSSKILNEPCSKIFIYSFAESIALTTIGCLIFRKKDLR